MDAGLTGTTPAGPSIAREIANENRMGRALAGERRPTSLFPQEKSDIDLRHSKLPLLSWSAAIYLRSMIRWVIAFAISSDPTRYFPHGKINSLPIQD